MYHSNNDLRAMQCCISLGVHTTYKVASTTGGRLQPALCHTVRVILSPMACHVLSQAHTVIEQAGDEPGALHALEPARAAVRAQQHKAASFSAHQRAAAKQAPFLLRFSASWIHTAMLTTEVSLLEKKKQYLPAVELLQLLLGACWRQVHLVAVLLAGGFCSCVWLPWAGALRVSCLRYLAARPCPGAYLRGVLTHDAYGL